MRSRYLRASAASGVLGVLAATCVPGGDGDGNRVAHSDEMTAAAVRDLLGGNQDFTGMVARLTEAIVADPRNDDARLFLAITTVLETARRVAVEPQGELNLMLNRAGLLNPNVGGSIWNFELELEDHGQGLFKDSTPTLGEFEDFLQVRVRPALEALAVALDSMPSDYEYVIPADKGGILLSLLSPGHPTDLYLDYGDTQLAAAALHAVLATLDLLGTLDWDDLAPNDFDLLEHPDLDALEIIRTRYPNLGRILRFNYLARSPDRLRTAWNAYRNASSHIRGEAPLQRDRGIVTLGREMFGNHQETLEFLAAEGRVRAMAGPMIDAFGRDQVFSIDSNPLTGDPLPAGDCLGINFFRFFQGVDPRDTYFRTVVDPIDDRRVLGVGRWSDLTDRMATFGGIVDAVGGSCPTPGDLQELLYAVRIDNPPLSTKQIDGSFADWQLDVVQVSDTPDAWVGTPSPDLGAAYVSVDSNYLFVYLDQSLMPFLTGAADACEFTVEVAEGEAHVAYRNGVGHRAWSSFGAVPDFAHNPHGIEMRFPLGTDPWARLEITFAADNSTYRVDSARGDIFVKVH